MLTGVGVCRTGGWPAKNIHEREGLLGQQQAALDQTTQ
jgi:hypothetical protein